VRLGFPPRLRLLLLAGDCVLIGASVLIAVWIRLQLSPIGETGLPALRTQHLWSSSVHRTVIVLSMSVKPAVLLTLLFVLLFYVFDLYDVSGSFSSRANMQRLCIAAITGALVASTLSVFLKDYTYGRGVFALALLLIPISTACWRIVFQHNHGRLPKLPILVLGTGNSAAYLEHLLSNVQSHYRLVGFVRSVGNAVARSVEAVPVAVGSGTYGRVYKFGYSNERYSEPVAVGPEHIVGDIYSLSNLVEEYAVRALIITDELIPARALPALTKLKFEGVSIHHSADFCMRISEELPLECLTDSWLWFSDGFDLLLAKLDRKLKRVADVMLSGIGLVAALPIIVAASLALWLDSEGPILYRQERVGLFERRFKIIKFRSMKTQAEKDGQPVWAIVNDHRITRVGRWLRRLHIDEIPQMINVLKGDMSFIGPRPERPEFVEQLKKKIPFYNLRHYVRPGITGWAQVCYPYGASVEEATRKLQFDLYYIRTASLLFDLRILLKTLQVVLYQRGSR
jgi:sugar transferase (PEP-CTERM system associated)